MTLLGNLEIAHAKHKFNFKNHKKRVETVPIECGATIGPGERVFLGHDLDCSDYFDGPALTVVGPVTFDLKNHTITGNGVDEGIVVLGTKARIKRGTITNCSDGVVLEGEGDHRLLRIHAIDNGDDGFVVATNNNRMVFTRAIDNGDNGYQINGHYTWLIKSRAEDNGDEGMYISSDENRILMNHSIGNVEENIEIDGDLNRVYHNHSKEGDDRGIDIEGNDNRVYKNKSMNNKKHGIDIDGDANGIIKNRSYSNGWNGFNVEEGVSGNVIHRNTAKNNGHADPSRYYDVFDENTDITVNNWKKNRYSTKSPDSIP